MTQNTVPLRPDFPAKFPSYWEAETAEETRQRPQPWSHHISVLTATNFTFYILNRHHCLCQIWLLITICTLWQLFTEFWLKQGTLPKVPSVSPVFEVRNYLCITIELTAHHSCVAATERNTRCATADVLPAECQWFSFESTCVVLGRSPHLWIWSEVGKGSSKNALLYFQCVWEVE